MRRHGRARRKTFPCNHFGFGQHCHRCELADELERACSGTGQVPPQLARNAKWTDSQMLIEAKRLRAVPTKG